MKQKQIAPFTVLKSLRCRIEDHEKWLYSEGIRGERGVFVGETFRDEFFCAKDLTQSDFKNCIFIGCRFVGKRLQTASFENCTFRGCNFRLSDLRGTNYNNCQFLDTVFDDAYLQGALFERCVVATCRMWRVTVDRETRFVKTSFDHVNLNGFIREGKPVFYKVEMQECVTAQKSGVTRKTCKEYTTARYYARHGSTVVDGLLELVDLRNRFLTEGEGFDFSGMILQGIDFGGRDLRGTDFRDSFLKNVNFSNCNLDACLFDRAVIEGSIFNNTTGAKLLNATVR